MDSGSSLSYGASDGTAAYYRQFSPAVPPQAPPAAPQFGAMDTMVKVCVLESKIVEQETRVTQLTERVAVLEHEMRRLESALEEKANRLEVQAALAAIRNIKELASASGAVHSSQSNGIEANVSEIAPDATAVRHRAAQEVKKAEATHRQEDDTKRQAEKEAHTTTSHTSKNDYRSDKEVEAKRATSSNDRGSTHDRRDDEDRRAGVPSSDDSSRRSGAGDTTRRESSPTRTSKRSNEEDDASLREYRSSADATSKRTRTRSDDYDRTDRKRRDSDEDVRGSIYKFATDDRSGDRYRGAPSSATDYSSYYSYYYGNAPYARGYDGRFGHGESHDDSSSTYDKDGAGANARVSPSSEFTPRPTVDDEQFAFKWTVGNPHRQGIYRVPKAAAYQMEESDVYFVIRLLEQNGKKVSPLSIARFLHVNELNALLTEEDRETMRKLHSTTIRAHCIKASFAANVWVTNTRTANDVVWLTDVRKPFRSRQGSEDYWTWRNRQIKGSSYRSHHVPASTRSYSTGHEYHSDSGHRSTEVADHGDKPRKREDSLHNDEKKQSPPPQQQSVSRQEKPSGQAEGQQQQQQQQPVQEGEQQQQQSLDQQHQQQLKQLLQLQQKQQKQYEQRASEASSQTTSGTPQPSAPAPSNPDVENFLRSIAHLAGPSPQSL